MKNILFTILFFPLISNSNAQGNLQFNQVINYTFVADMASTGGILVDTVMFCVPIGKVWKIESFGTPKCCGSGTSPNSLFLSSSSAYRYGFLNASATVLLSEYAANNANLTPIWLQSGYCGQFTFNSGTGSATQTQTALISIIEFNVVP